MASTYAARLSCFSPQPIGTERQPAQHPAICGVESGGDWAIVDLGRLAISLSAISLCSCDQLAVALTSLRISWLCCFVLFCFVFVFVCFVFCFVSFFRPAFVAVCFSFRFPYSFRSASFSVLYIRFLSCSISFSWRLLCLFLAFPCFFFFPLFFCGSQVSRQPYSAGTAQLSSAQPSHLVCLYQSTSTPDERTIEPTTDRLTD